jgi:hypothetical protein
MTLHSDDAPGGRRPGDEWEGSNAVPDDGGDADGTYDDSPDDGGDADGTYDESPDGDSRD